MRLASLLLLCLMVTFASPGTGSVLPCACGCGAVEDLCPCEHPGRPAAPGCMPHGGGTMAPLSASVQAVQAAHADAVPGRALPPAVPYPVWIAAKDASGLLGAPRRGPPRPGGNPNQGTRLAALSVFRI